MILIRMNENPGTGYRWQIVTDDKDGFDQTLCQLQPTSGFADGLYEPSTSTDGSDDKVVDGVARPYVPPGQLAPCVFYSFATHIFVDVRCWRLALSLPMGRPALRPALHGSRHDNCASPVQTELGGALQLGVPSQHLCACQSMIGRMLYIYLHAFFNNVMSVEFGPTRPTYHFCSAAWGCLSVHHNYNAKSNEIFVVRLVRAAASRLAPLAQQHS
jgi:hypothetical protein